MEKETGTCLKIKCNTREAEFYLQKYRKVGKTISNCIKYNGRWISPPAMCNNNIDWSSLKLEVAGFSSEGNVFYVGT